MGSPEDEEGRRAHEGPQHRVRITEPFYMGKYEVTQQQWQAVMGNNPSEFKGPDNPVEKVSWNDCQAFTGKLNEGVGQSGAEYSLPTEAQWEYACRAGSTTRWFFGDDEAGLSEYAWGRAKIGDDRASFREDAPGRGKTGKASTHPVGQKKPNAWGLYDVHGNVSEWCADCYRESPRSPSRYYGRSPLDDPTGPASGRWRVLRGGRCAGRTIHSPGYRQRFMGFRVVRRIPPLYLELPDEVGAQPTPD
jgi:formylglycine-generating enzyme required for sulfatase activity